jgi:iron-sulfur cluster assembly accessory protein
MSDCGNVKKVFVKPKEKSKEVAEPINGIVITDKAASKIKLFLEGDGKSHLEYGLRIGVKKDGCSGLSYDMNLSDIKSSKDNADKIFTKDNAFVMIEKASYFHVYGSELDYSEALTGSGFTLINPNVKKSCACGSSFAV